MAPQLVPRIRYLPESGAPKRRDHLKPCPSKVWIRSDPGVGKDLRATPFGLADPPNIPIHKRTSMFVIFQTVHREGT